MSEIVEQAFRVGFKAGVEHVIQMLERSKSEFANHEVFDESTLEAIGILIASLRHVEKIINESSEAL